jgi:hypothetical protein
LTPQWGSDVLPLAVNGPGVPMSRFSLTVLKHLPVGYWLIVAWCALQSLPFLALATRLNGDAALAAFLGFVLQAAFAAGMLLRLRWVRWLLILHLAGALFLGTIVVAVLGLLHVYVGLAHIETLIAGLAAGVYLFLIWVWFYLFHPNLTEVFEWNWAQNATAPQARAASLPQAA